MLSPDHFQIDEVKLHDLDEIVAIENMSFPTPWPRHVFDLELKSSRSFKRVSRVNGSVVGYLVAWKIYDEVHILNVAVHPDYRRRGIGQSLLDYCINFFSSKGVRSAILEVRNMNGDARRLYEKMGFRSVGVRRGYYTDTGEDAIVMELDLK